MSPGAVAGPSERRPASSAGGRRLIRRGYRFVSIDTALADPADDRPDRFFGPSGISWLERWAIAADRGRELFPEDPPPPAWVLELAGFDSE